MALICDFIATILRKNAPPEAVFSLFVNFMMPTAALDRRSGVLLDIDVRIIIIFLCLCKNNYCFVLLDANGDLQISCTIYGSIV